MERFRKIIPFSLLFIVVATMACGIGTETGNPEIPPPAANAPQDTNTYQNNYMGIELDYPTTWLLSGGAADESAPSGDVADDDSSTTETLISNSALAIFTNGAGLTIVISSTPLSEEPEDILEYLGELVPDKDIGEYCTNYICGFAYEEVGEITTKIIYFLNGNILIEIMAEISDGSGGTEVNFILNSIRFAE